MPRRPTKRTRTVKRTQSPIRIRAVGPGDAGLVAPLFDAYRRFYRLRSDPAAARRFLRERLRKRQSVLYVAFVRRDGRSMAAGFVHLYPSFSSLSMKRLWILNDLFVDPAFRRLGVGEALMRRAERLARSTGAAGIGLETASDNRAAQLLYERLGYRRYTQFYRYFLPL
jgi:ribosomal protein S18 acetylase RimI-like enzyme